MAVNPKCLEAAHQLLEQLVLTTNETGSKMDFVEHFDQLAYEYLTHGPKVLHAKL